MSSSGLSRATTAPQTVAAAPSYMNVDLGSDASPLSPSHSTCESTTTPMREEPSTEGLDGSNNSCCGRAYMNISPGQEKLEALPAPPKARPAALAILHQQQSEPPDDGSRHCYANLEASDIEGLKKRFSAASIAEKLPLQAQTPPPLLGSIAGIREVSYAVLDLDKKEATSSLAMIGATATTTTTTTATSTILTGATTEASTTAQLPGTWSPPDSPLKVQQIGYVTIDFNKTTALSHSANASLVSDIDEGSRRTRHNSTITELMAPPSRHNSSISE